MSILIKSAALAALAGWSAAPTVTSTGGTDPNTQDPPRGTFAVQCGTLHVGDGQILNNVWLVVRDGKVESINQSLTETSLPVVDASDKVIAPGLVAPDTDLAPQRDDVYNITPDFVAADGFDYTANWRSPLSGGVTTAYLSPGRNRLVTGQGSVVKLAGSDLLERVLEEKSALRVTMGLEAVASQWVFEPTPHPTSDDPLLPARLQVPNARISLLTEMRRLFAESATAGDTLQGGDTVSGENRYDATALANVVAGSLPLRISAKEAADIQRALRFAQELGVRPILEDPWEFNRVAAMAKSVGASCVFRMEWAPGVSVGNDNRNPKLARRDPGAPAEAHRRGIPFALAALSNSGLRDFLMVPALAVRHGLDPAAALRAVTLGAAEVLGVADRVGSLEPGKDADFIVLSGEPLAVGTMVEQTWVDGTRAWTRKTDTSILAVRTSRVLSGDGATWRDGVIIAADGRIKDVGEELAMPYGAEVIDIPGGVAVPGFIDAYSFLGMAGPTGAAPQGSPDQRIADVVSHKDPLFASALGAGLTTVLVSGPDGDADDQSRPAGRVAALKTGAADRDAMALAPIAGMRFLVDDIKPGGINAIKSVIDRGKKYVEAWKKYDQALADFKAGKGEKPKEIVEDTSAAPKEDPISGVWEVELQEAPVPLTLVLDMTLKGTTITGTVAVTFRGRGGQEAEITSGSMSGNSFTITFSGMGGEATAEGTVNGESCTGTVELGPLGKVGFTGTRTQKRAGTSGGEESDAGDDDGSPKKPNVDENLEPIRALLSGDAPAIVRADRAPAIRAALAYFASEGIPMILHGGDDAAEDSSVLELRPATPENAPADDGEPAAKGGDKAAENGNGAKGAAPAAKPAPAAPKSTLAGFLLEPNFIDREGRKVTNRAAQLADRGTAVALVSAAGEGSKSLPLHAAFAVRYGMSPQDALAALTIHPAKMFQLDDRIGSLRKGKDADFVVFSGDPFEPTSRVMLVVVNGKVVIDNRESK